MDGLILFKNLDIIDHTKNSIYIDLINSFKPKIALHAQNYGKDLFNKYCFFAFRSNYQDNDMAKQLGKIFSTVIFCLSQDSSDAILNNFSKNFVHSYSEKISKEVNLMKIQNYHLKQNIQIQYYDTIGKIYSNNLKLRNFYTSFAKEGLVLNEDANFNPLKVKHSFRFDQVVDCNGTEASIFKSIIDPKISSHFRPNHCCVSYLVDWHGRGVKNLFCSKYTKDWQCKVDIKIFTSTLYNFCIEKKVENIDKLIIRSNNNIKDAQLSFLERASIITVLRDILYMNPEKYIDRSSHLYNLVKNAKKTAKINLLDSLRAFDLDYSKTNKKGCKFGKEEFLLDENKKDFVVKNQNKSISHDLNNINSREKKDLYNDGGILIKILNRMKISFCKELLKLRDLEIELRNKTIDINQKQTGNRELTESEINNIINAIFKSSELLKVGKKKIQIIDTNLNFFNDSDYKIKKIKKRLDEKGFEFSDKINSTLKSTSRIPFLNQTSDKVSRNKNNWKISIDCNFPIFLKKLQSLKLDKIIIDAISNEINSKRVDLPCEKGINNT